MYLIFDTESTDMLKFKLPADHPEQARIVQIAGVLTDATLKPIGQMSRIIKPDGWVIQPGAQKAHGISLERCHDEGVPIAQAMDEFDSLFEKADTLCAYNLRWDNKFLRGEKRRLKRPDHFGTKREFDVMRAVVPVCKMPATVAMKRAGRGAQFKQPNLTQAHEILCGCAFEGAHDAMSDVLATLAIMVALRDNHQIDMRGEFPESYADKPKPERALKGSVVPKDEQTLFDNDEIF